MFSRLFFIFDGLIVDYLLSYTWWFQMIHKLLESLISIIKINVFHVNKFILSHYSGVQAKESLFRFQNLINEKFK